MRGKKSGDEEFPISAMLWQSIYFEDRPPAFILYKSLSFCRIT